MGSVSSHYSPLQGLGLDGTTIEECSDSGTDLTTIEGLDFDKRQNLGVYYWNENQLQWPQSWEGLMLNYEYILGYNTDPITAAITDITSDSPNEIYPNATATTSFAVERGNTTADLFKYYDPTLESQRADYNLLVAPAEVRIDFEPLDYPSQGDTNCTYYPWSSNLSDYSINDKVFVAFIDWGDGSRVDLEEPLIVFDESVVDQPIYHTYEKSGIYRITGLMYSSNNPILNSFKQFEMYINLNKDLSAEEEFQQLGGSGYTFIPYNETVPVVGGVSKYSAYNRSVAGRIASTGETGYDVLQGEAANLHASNIAMNGYIIGDDLAVDNLLYPYTLSIYNDCEGESPDCGAGSLVHNGFYKNPEELGDHLGLTDLAQVRAFTKPYQIHEMLGFRCTEENTYDFPIYNALSHDAPRKNITFENDDGLNTMPEGWSNNFDTRFGTWEDHDDDPATPDILINPNWATEFTDVTDLPGFTKAFHVVTAPGVIGWGGLHASSPSFNPETRGLPVLFGAWVKVMSGVVQFGNLNTHNRLAQGPTNGEWKWVTSFDPNWELDSTGEGVQLYACAGGHGGCDGAGPGYDVHDTTGEHAEFYVAGLQAIVGIDTDLGWFGYAYHDAGECFDEETGNPAHERYWRNIIPEDVAMTDRDGLYVNAIPDGSFETRTYNTPYLGPSVHNGILTFSTEESLFGGVSLKHEATGYGSYTNSNVFHPIESNALAVAAPEETWTFSGYCKSHDSSAGMRMFIFGLKDDYEWIGSLGDSYVGDEMSETCTDEWQRFSNTITFSHSGVRYVSTRLDNNSSGKIIYWDGLQLEKSSTPSEFSSKILSIEEGNPQEWLGQNEYDNTYYYPVLPKYNGFGLFDETLGLQGQPENIPFGHPNRSWDENDEKAYVTSDHIVDSELRLDLDFSSVSNNAMYDLGSGGNTGMLMRDYSVSLSDDRTFQSRRSGIGYPKLGTANKKKAF